MKKGDRVVWLEPTFSGQVCIGCGSRHRVGVIKAIEPWGIMVSFRKHPCLIQIPRRSLMLKAEWQLQQLLRGKVSY